MWILTQPESCPADVRPSCVTGGLRPTSKDPLEFALAEGLTLVEALASLLGLLDRSDSTQTDPASWRDSEF
jgi:hypothetical protein